MLHTSDNSCPADPGRSRRGGQFPVPHDTDRLQMAFWGGRCSGGPGDLPDKVAPGPPAILHVRPQQMSPDPAGSAALARCDHAAPWHCPAMLGAPRREQPTALRRGRPPQPKPLARPNLPRTACPMLSQASRTGHQGTSHAWGRRQLPHEGQGQAGLGVGGGQVSVSGAQPPHGWVLSLVRTQGCHTHANASGTQPHPHLSAPIAAPRRRGWTGQEPRQREALSAELLSAVSVSK